MLSIILVTKTYFYFITIYRDLFIGTLPYNLPTTEPDKIYSKNKLSFSHVLLTILWFPHSFSTKSHIPCSGFHPGYGRTPQLVYGILAWYLSECRRYSISANSLFYLYLLCSLTSLCSLLTVQLVNANSIYNIMWDLSQCQYFLLISHAFLGLTACSLCCQKI